MRNTTENRIARALEALEAGFTSKAGQKRALEELSRAYDSLAERARDAIRAGAPYQDLGRDLTAAEWQARGEYFAGRELPFELHNVRARHFADLGEHAATVEQLIELRAAIKAAPIVKAERDPKAERAIAIRSSILEIMEKRGAQYDRALTLGELFNGLPVSANVHLVTNEHGTTFVRAFYYLAGEFTPLNVILAAAEELERRKAD